MCLCPAMPAKMMSARGGAAAAGDVSVADSPLASFETLTQAAIIAVMGIAIVVSNILIIASFLNLKGKCMYETNIVLNERKLFIKIFYGVLYLQGNKGTIASFSNHRRPRTYFRKHEKNVTVVNCVYQLN